MLLPHPANPVHRSTNVAKLAVASVGPSNGPCDPCIAQCLKLYGNNPVYYSACCETCGDISRVCWYACCAKGPKCSVPA